MPGASKIKIKFADGFVRWQYDGYNIEALKRFELEDLMVVKFSFHRQEIQGSRGDRDMHGAQIANLFSELNIKVLV